jgi:hypothetical protein
VGHVLHVLGKIKESLKPPKSKGSAKHLTGWSSNDTQKDINSHFLILEKEVGYFVLVWVAFFRPFMLIFGRFGLLRGLIVNFNFQNLWARSSEEEEYVMSLNGSHVVYL